VYKVGEKSCLDPKKTRFKKPLIIGSNAVIYQESNPEVESAWFATLMGIAIWKNHPENQRDSMLTHP
jgi:hypothetical protein